jgi:hypothetical protein
MKSGSIFIAHLVSSDMAPDAVARLRALPAGPPEAQAVLHLGVGAGADLPGRRVVRVHAAAPLAWLRQAALAQALDRCCAASSGRGLVLHAWTTSAARWALPLAAGNRPLLVDTRPEDDPRRPARWSAGHTLSYMCESNAACARLTGAGIPAVRCLVVPPPPPTPVTASTRAESRSALRLTADDIALALVPPVTRASGAFIATWAGFLVEKIQHAVRLLVPRAGRDAGRIAHLIKACRHEWMVRFTPRDMDWSAILAAADVALWLPRSVASTTGVWGAKWAGCRIVATDTAVAREVLGHDHRWLCRSDSPEHAARAALAALEAPLQVPLPALAAAAGDATNRFGAAYERAYALLSSRRPVAAAETAGR